jgi:cytochrome c553
MNTSRWRVCKAYAAGVLVYNSAPFALESVLMKLSSMILLSALCGLAAQAWAEGSVEEGQTKATACTACHGDKGNSVNPLWPTIAGQHTTYIIKQLKAFKSGTRTDPLMSPMAVGLSEDDIEDLAAFFAAQTPSGLEADPSKVSLGQRLYRGGDASSGIAACGACHGPGGDGNPAALYPAIKSQHATYTATQLRNYRAGTRRTDQNQMMRDIADTMSDEQIDAVASYVQGLR